MNKTWHFYDKATGMFTGRTFSAPDDSNLSHNTPEGHGAHCAKEHIDHLCHRLDLVSGEIIPHQLIQPSPDHTLEDGKWVVDHKRIARRRERETRLARIAALEKKLPRALLEHALGYDGALQRLRDIDNELISLRGELNGTATVRD